MTDLDDNRPNYFPVIQQHSSVNISSSMIDGLCGDPFLICESDRYVAIRSEPCIGEIVSAASRRAVLKPRFTILEKGRIRRWERIYRHRKLNRRREVTMKLEILILKGDGSI